jgi:hypothetical protein
VAARGFSLNLPADTSIESGVVPQPHSIMITRHFRSASVTMLLLSIAGMVLATSAWTMEVKAGRGLRLVVVDAQKFSPARDAVHRAFVANLASAATKRAGSPIEISVRAVVATDARSRLTDGMCDAVLVLGEDRPAVLRRLDALTLCGELDPEAGTRPAYLIVGKDDAAMRDLLASAFANVLADRVALKSIETAERDASGMKVAALAP